jgi:hypothetical protein
MNSGSKKREGRKRMKPSMLVLLLAFCLIASCTYGSSNIVDKSYEDVSTKIIKGESTKASIMKTFGVPMAKGRNADGNEKWTYSEVKMVPVPFGPAWVKTLEVTFGRDGTVTDFSLTEMNRY